MRWLPILLTCVILCPLAPSARAEGERAGAFDYYVLSLSWSPTWCALEGEARNSPQCERALGWVLHGLWPQYTRGYPSYCDSTARPPSRKETAAMADIMGTPGLAWYQWKKHGVCAGLSAQDYFALARRAYESVSRPEVLRRLEDPVTLPATVIEEAFLQANPGWEPDMLTITCQSGRIQEARLCLSKELEPVPCGQDVVKDCRLGNALLDPIR
ncbi:ribonuclease T2 family protein [Alloyangia pacifica]|uniref:Ribonuclease T2 n=1 Tax=Alloyangia pacifica TaxID=311180 RepID=A0A1I6QN79_9RHOB|nr:ribonuclease T2 [Alloyangia pacifica]SDF93376.1 ribonuclease T2 [Alloyangia pacifica]SFS53782.1 ribonuclease T2 [Alloyangia pacifica]